ncbi:DUF58 domain-containing protein [Microbacterium sp. SORGH_AS_0862]|uniref:DUF58 domain-containing protein n=1 Tax=Microbacterium sp. SORGH_AS_0862 TaxID=3041789 RepID=UPI0027938948|nr:DUF58 domain-containing protein [Microbacterium sp. SORGH_AS_0862]MDQ1204219.1 uncharacterized protein (DUF58 family) [Microbacterium sp. SORGH_AS_0862]
MFVTGRLPIVVAGGLIPLVLLSAAGIPAWAVFGAWLLLVIAAVAVDTALAPRPADLRVARTLPARARRGKVALSELRLTNTARRRMRGWVRDAWQPTAGAPAARARIDVPSGQTITLRASLMPRRRGELTTDFVVVRALGPLGLAGRQQRIDARGVLRVLPPFSSRRHLPSRLARLRELDGETSVQVRGRGTEFDSLREYVRGDDVRAIDWRATARSATTMLRTWRPERDRHIVVVIDTGRTAATRVDDGVRLDAAMEATLLLGALAARAGDHVHLVMMDRLVRARVSGVDGAALVPALVDAMAPVEAQLIDTDWSEVASLVRRLTARPALVVLLTAQDDPAAARGFLAALPTLTARSRVLVASASTVGDTDDETAMTDADAAYTWAAAEHARQGGERVGAAIGRAGAVAVTADAASLPPRVADHYLALKLRGLL